MFYILGWMIFALIVGFFAKLLHPGEDPIGFLPTIGIGIVGSFVGGALEFLINMGAGGFGPSGLVFSVIGSVLFCWGYRRYRLGAFFQENGRLPLR